MPGVGRRYASRGIAAGLVGAGALCLAWGANATTGGPASDPFASLTPITASGLSNLRGGFFVNTRHGTFRFDFGVSIRLQAKFSDAVGGHLFEMTTNLIFNDHGKVSGVSTTSQGSLPGGTTVAVNTPGGSPPPSNPTVQATGSPQPLTNNPAPQNNPTPQVVANTNKIGEGAGASVEIKNPNLNVVQRITKDNITLINQIKGDNISFSQEIVGNLVAKNFSQILNSTARSLPHINRINRQIGVFMTR